MNPFNLSDTTKNMELNKAEWLNDQVKSVLQEQFSSDRWEQFFDFDFITVWEELGYPKELEAYKSDFLNRSAASLDAKKMIDVAIEQHEIENLEFDFYIDNKYKITRAIKLGYALAINGENPTIT